VGPTTFALSLKSPSNAILGTPNAAVLTITGNNANLAGSPNIGYDYDDGSYFACRHDCHWTGIGCQPE
jgi:hypothetical protein